MSRTPDTAAGLIAVAAGHLAAGDLAAVETACRRGLEDHAGESEFDHLLGLALSRTERRDEGVDHLRRAVAARPDDPARRHNLAVVLDAVRDPDAEAVLIENTRRAPEFAPSWYSLATLLMRRGDAAGALAALKEATRAAPADVQSWNNLGVASLQLGQKDDAAQAFGRALTLSPNHPEALFNLASLLAGAARYAETVGLWRSYVALRPEHAAGWHGLAVALFNCADWAGAADAYRRTHALEAGNVEAIRGLAVALKQLGDVSAAETLLLEALRLAPGHVNALNSLGATYMEQGRPEDAMSVLRVGLAIAPERADLHSNLLFAMQYSAAVNNDEIAAERERFQARHGAAAIRSTSFDNTPDPERRLRIGYVSADFRLHSCAYFFEPLLAARDHSAFETYCYSALPHSDATTSRLRGMADHWRDISGLSDEAAVRLVRDDRIDLLIDLSGHTAGNRLTLFARKPAPVQLSWLGFPDDTGLAAIDARIGDAIVDPPAAPGSSSGDQRVARLAHGFHCYWPPSPCPEVAPLPASRNGFVTFGSFNNVAKLTRGTIRLWASLLRRVARSRLVLKHWQLADAPLRSSLLRNFLVEGVTPDRIDALPRVPDQTGHMAVYNSVDIGLDTFPYHGTTTTCEALWMGVPVVTRAGERPAARVGASLLTRIGMETLIARSDEEYVLIASRLAADLATLAQLRSELRGRMQRSPLGDAAQWVPNMEDVIRRMWREWCAGAASSKLPRHD